MAVKDIMDALREASVDNTKLTELIKDIKLIGSSLEVVYRLPKKELEEEIRRKTYQALENLPDVKNVNIRFVEGVPEVPPAFGQPAFTRRRVEGVKHLIAVGSGKGGVGKSTVAANLAVALSKLGYQVGLLDADIYGPSIPTLFGVKGERVHVDERNRLIPIEKYGIKILSIGFLLPSEDTPVIWRGPMLMKALTQFLFDVNWGNLDYLVLDLPPGTGDVQLTLAQNVDMTGAIVVTTPQDVALADVKKATAMFKEVNVPVLGVIENMAYFICPESGNKYYVFGKGKVLEFVRAYQLQVLGSIPMDPQVAETSDTGMPITLTNPESEVSKAFYAIAKLVSERILRR
ncbi:ATPase-like, ParA/MinD [Hydrogenobacter thermophilus TK-6]|uniref:Iron-sulfur cluster carrier protein n=1 Tax=Hydrogenobacter thermophilus (strain DSM 6534 / IAM 12695 / TK-6) TaxID=608538 RepID=D3DIG0_HYDTT|nr:Mrp/NBP35 family ATP-binding protein [Hydrogenobacter thermophilus]ADO45538.1 ATPase-like, ParA/MinD [Hydrogenobacter thermophilus TK-6]BAI69612.1 ATP/GTP-binding protein [Hydrogenobacter thermophilus TK-6]